MQGFIFMLAQPTGCQPDLDILGPQDHRPDFHRGKWWKVLSDHDGVGLVLSGTWQNGHAAGGWLLAMGEVKDTKQRQYALMITLFLPLCSSYCVACYQLVKVCMVPCVWPLPFSRVLPG